MPVPLIPVDRVRSVDGYTATTITVPEAFLGLCQLCHAPPQIGFLFRVESLADFFVLVFVMVFAFYFKISMWLVGLNHWCSHHCNPFEYKCGRHVPFDAGSWPMPRVCLGVASSTALSRGASCSSNSCLPAIQSVWWGIQLGGLAESYLIPSPSLHDGEGFLF